MTATDELPGVLVVVSALEALGLAVEKQRRTHWQSQCPNPEHPDSEASLCIDVKPYHGFGPMNAVIRCPVCGWKGSDVCQALGLPVRILFGNHERYRYSDRPTCTAPLSEDLLRSHRKALQESPKRLAYLHEHRGLTLATIERFELGYDDDFYRYMLPVRDARRQLVNFRRYRPDAETDKMINAAGHGRPRLYPLPLRPRWPWLLVVEGEWDALLARQHHLPAVTGTEGAGTWEDSWSRSLAGRKVAFAFDCDKAGREGADKAAKAVAKVAAAVKVVDLGLGEGEDVSDWFLKYGRSSKDLRELISATPALDAGGGGAGD